MAVAALTAFPNSFIAGDTVRVTLADSRFPSSGWTLKVILQGPTAVYSFDATTGTNGAYYLTITAAQSKDIPPGFYVLSKVYTETATGERQSPLCNETTTVYGNPEVAAEKSIARQTLEAGEAALKILMIGSNATVNFNGQSFTKRSIPEFQTALDRQRAVVRAEDIARIGGPRSLGRIFHPL